MNIPYPESKVVPIVRPNPANHRVVIPEVTGVEWWHRKVPLSYRGHVRGFHHVAPGHDSVAFESLLERDTIEYLVNIPGFRRIRTQPFTIFFKVNGQRRWYTPDILVDFDYVPSDLEWLGLVPQAIIECKPADKVVEEAEKLDVAFRAVQLAVGQLPMLITEEDLIPDLQEVRHAA